MDDEKQKYEQQLTEASLVLENHLGHNVGLLNVADEIRDVLAAYKEQTDRMLIAAVNVLAEYAERNLPDGYTVHVSFWRHGGHGKQMTDPRGNEVVLDDDEQLSFRLACDAALTHLENNAVNHDE